MQTKNSISEQNENLITRAAELTIIEDGQVKYPVDSEDLRIWEECNGKMAARTYEQFCDEVDNEAEYLNVGTQAMIDLCDALVEAGAATYRPA